MELYLYLIHEFITSCYNEIFRCFPQSVVRYNRLPLYILLYAPKIIRHNHPFTSNSTLQKLSKKVKVSP
jgi:hypothetical protein